MPIRIVRRLYLLVTVIATMTTAPAWIVAGEDDVVSASKSAVTIQIDHHLRAAWEQRGIIAARPASERALARRLYLDLAGRIPTVEEVDAFLADKHDDKRNRLIDALLASEDHVQHFADTFDTLLMGRGGDAEYGQRVKGLWRNYLESVVRENRPWNEVVVEILLGRPDDRSKGSAWFLYERNNDHQAIAEAVAPAVFGIRIECAQCHDHMVAGEIKQEHYWGLVAFFNRGKNETTKNGPRVAESAIGGFSEFANLHGDSSPNLLTFFGAGTVHEPRPEKDAKQEDKDELYVAAAKDGDPRIPKFSRRATFVKEIVEGHPLIARAMVNRVWAMLMGRGIVHPHDEMDSVHEPSHPELLGWLSGDFTASGYDVRRLVRAIVTSDAYQLDSTRPEGVEDPATFAWYLERPLIAEQLARSAQVALRGEAHSDANIVMAMRRQFQDVLAEENVTTISDALFLSNNKAVHDLIDSSNDEQHLRQRVVALPTHEDRARLMFVSTMGRMPEEDESAAIVDYLKQREATLPAAVDQVIWSLLTSAEFRFNH